MDFTQNVGNNSRLEQNNTSLQICIHEALLSLISNVISVCNSLDILMAVLIRHYLSYKPLQLELSQSI